MGSPYGRGVGSAGVAGQMMNADEARRFVSGKVFAFTCFDGTRGAGRVLDDGGAAGAVQFSGSGPVRHIRLPGNTLQVAASPSARRSRAFRSSRVSISTRRTSATSAIGLGHGLRLLRFPPSGRGADADGAGSSSAALAEAAGADRGGRSSANRGDGASRDSVGRERQNRAGQIRDEIRAGEIGECFGATPLDRLTRPSAGSGCAGRRRPAAGTGFAGTASRSPPALGPGT